MLEYNGKQPQCPLYYLDKGSFFYRSIDVADYVDRLDFDFGWTWSRCRMQTMDLSLLIILYWDVFHFPYQIFFLHIFQLNCGFTSGLLL